MPKMTEKEIETLRKLSDHKAESVAHTLGVMPWTVHYWRRKLNIKKTAVWDKDLLHRLYIEESKTSKEIAKILKKPGAQVRVVLSKLNIRRGIYVRWSREELALLQKEVRKRVEEGRSLTDVTKLFPTKSKQVVYNKAYKLAKQLKCREEI